MIHCTSSTDALVTLETMEPWNLHATRIRIHQRILEVS